MRICFLFSETVSSVRAEEGSADIFLLPFSALGEVNFDDEIAGRSEKLKDLARLSKNLSAAVICGGYTDIKGIKRKSAVAANKGKIIGVADGIICDDKKFRPGAGLKIFDFPAGKIGVAVGEDVMLPDVIKSLAACGCAAAVCPFETLSSAAAITVARAHAFIYGITVCLAANNYSFAVAPSGDIAFATGISGFIYEFAPSNEYRIRERKVRGFAGF